MALLRPGRKMSQTEGLQTVYLQLGGEPSDEDPCVGVLVTPDLAEAVIEAVNSNDHFSRLVLTA